MLDKESLNKVVIALMAGAVTWLFVQSVRIDPVVEAVEKLTTVMELSEFRNNERAIQIQKDNSIQHGELALMVNTTNNNIASAKVKLFRVIEDCKEQGVLLSKCHAEHIILKGI